MEFISKCQKSTFRFWMITTSPRRYRLSMGPERLPPYLGTGSDEGQNRPVPRGMVRKKALMA